MEVKKGDFVLCNYEGKEYTGRVMEISKNDIVNIQICTSSKRAEKPIFEEVTMPVSELRRPNI